MTSNFADLAPRGPIKSAADQWDVFLSYRSVSRPWVLRLYDALRALGYDTFMDQFVLNASDGLRTQLEKHLQHSATGVLIWSHRSEDSKWCQDEYDALRNLESNKAGFRYVVVNVDKSDLPVFARAKLWIDFSDLRDGPSGTGLLRLLFGLHGKPLPPEAVKLAADYDDATRRALARIAAARESGDAETLKALPQEGAIEWSSSSLLPCKVAEALIAIRRPADALPILDAMIAKFPLSIRPKQLKGLALARSGDWRAAQQLLGELAELGEKDPETLGILARTWRDRYAQSGDIMHLRKARNLYAEAFESTPSDYYVGINAASNSVLLGDLEAAERHAANVEKLVGTQAKPGDYWASATVGEVQLIRRRFPEAAAIYAAAVEDDPEAKASHEATIGQARRLMEKLAPSAEERAKIEAAFGNLA